MALSADLICNYQTQVIGQNYMERLQTPNANHLLGTDAYGRDILFRIIHGARLSLSIGIITILSSLIVGLVFGCLAGYYGGLMDGFIMRITDIFLAIPPLLLAVAVVGVLGPSYINLIIAMGVGYVPYFARVVRAPLLQIRDREFIEAAKAVGTSDFRIIPVIYCRIFFRQSLYRSVWALPMRLDRCKLKLYRSGNTATGT